MTLLKKKKNVFGKVELIEGTLKYIEDFGLAAARNTSIPSFKTANSSINC